MTEQGDKHQSNETTTEKAENKPKRKKTLFRRLLCLISAVVFLPVFFIRRSVGDGNRYTAVGPVDG